MKGCYRKHGCQRQHTLGWTTGATQSLKAHTSLNLKEKKKRVLSLLNESDVELKGMKKTGPFLARVDGLYTFGIMLFLYKRTPD